MEARASFVDASAGVATLPHYVVVGERTLELISELETFNRWMFDAIRPYVGRRVLEAGAGIGTFTALLEDRELVVALELERDRVERMVARFAEHPNVEPVGGDLVDPALTRLAERRLDTVICLNVLEHVEEDRAALLNMWRLLQPGGRLLLLVPAHPSLYNTLDVGLGHFRRYRAPELQALLEQVGFRIERRFYLNLFGTLGWWLNGNVLRRTLLPEGQLGLYERLAPLFRGIEALLGRRWGLSVIFIAQKPA